MKAIAVLMVSVGLSAQVLLGQTTNASSTGSTATTTTGSLGISLVSDGTGPALPASATNAFGSAATMPVIGQVLNWLPYWNSALTNPATGKPWYGSGELVIGVAPLWKSMTAAGSTPYLDVAADYYVSQWLGVGAEAITLGTGTGDNSLDTVMANITARKSFGNIAFYWTAGGGYDLNTSKIIGATGPGASFAYQNNLRLFTDLRGTLEDSGNRGWMVRVGIQLKF